MCSQGFKFQRSVPYFFDFNTAFSISTPVLYYLNTNNIDIVVILLVAQPQVVPHATLQLQVLLQITV